MKAVFNDVPNLRLNLLHVLVGMIPAGILGFLFDDLIEKYLFSVPTNDWLIHWCNLHDFS